MQLDCVGAAADSHHLAVARWAVVSPVAATARDAVLAGDQGGVGGEDAAVGDDRRRACEQRRPHRGGGPDDQHLAGLDAVEVAEPVDQANRAGGGCTSAAKGRRRPGRGFGGIQPPIGPSFDQGAVESLHLAIGLRTRDGVR